MGFYFYFFTEKGKSDTKNSRITFCFRKTCNIFKVHLYQLFTFLNRNGKSLTLKSNYKFSLRLYSCLEKNFDQAVQTQEGTFIKHRGHCCFNCFSRVVVLLEGDSPVFCSTYHIIILDCPLISLICLQIKSEQHPCFCRRSQPLHLFNSISIFDGQDGISRWFVALFLCST